MSPLCALCPAIALVSLLALGVRRARLLLSREGRIPWATLLWATIPAVCLVTLTGTGAAGLLEASVWPLPLVCSSVICVACGYGTLRRNDVWNWLASKSRRMRGVLIGALVLLVVFCALLCVELPYNDYFLTLVGPTHYWIEVPLCALLLLGLYFLGQRHAAACSVGFAFFLVTGLGQFFVGRFKNAAILPTDVLAIQTAAAVTKEYVFTLSDTAVLGILSAVVAMCALSLVPTPTPDASNDKARHPRLMNFAGSACAFALFIGLISLPSYGSALGVQMEYWFSLHYYKLQGFYPTFIAVLQDMPIRKPDGYQTELAEQLEQQYAQAYHKDESTNKQRQAATKQFEQIKPSVVVVMNESFSDLSCFEKLHADYTGPEFFKRGLADTSARGTLNVNVYGGSTCNSEFEFLTGNSLTFIGGGKYPYSIYDLSNVDSLPQEFKEWNYTTAALHPNFPSNWNRDKVYDAMGFDAFLAMEEFGGLVHPEYDKFTPNEPHAEVFHSGVSDAGTYEQVLRLLKVNPEPQFLFDVTMANHGSYDQNNIPQAYRTNYVPSDYQGEDAPERLNEYLACIQKSDDDLKAFIEELRQLERPVLLVFFGDHQPNITQSFNDAWFTDEAKDVHARRTFHTDYVIWANYELAGASDATTPDEMSVDMLAAKALELVGAPLSDFQAAQLEIRKQIPSLSVAGYLGADGVWYQPDEESPYAEAYHDLAQIEYLNFAERI